MSGGRRAGLGSGAGYHGGRRDVRNAPDQRLRRRQQEVRRLGQWAERDGGRQPAGRAIGHAGLVSRLARQRAAEAEPDDFRPCPVAGRMVEAERGAEREADLHRQREQRRPGGERPVPAARGAPVVDGCCAGGARHAIYIAIATEENENGNVAARRTGISAMSGRQGRPRRGQSRPRHGFAANANPVEIEVARLGGRGDGVGEAEFRIGRGTARRPAFVPFALPGERVLARPVADRGEGVACELTELLSTSAERIEPACRHFMTCGGCAVQHLEPAAYRAWKREQVCQALARAGLGEVPVGELLPAAPGERRRADFVLRRLGGRMLAGFHERASNRLVALEECPVLRPPVFGLLRPLAGALAPFLAEGEAAEAVVNELDSGLDLLLRLSAEPDLVMREALAAFAATTDLARLAIRVGADGFALPLAERRPPRLDFAGVAVTPPPGAFLQATRSGEAALQAAVREGVSGAARVLDLYAGCGTLTFAAAASAQVRAVEGEAELLAAIRRAADAAGLGGRVETETRDLAHRPFSAKELKPFDAVVLDPPRAGAREQAGELAASQVPRIVYVSCNPATFARDARILADGGYRLEAVQPIDQFLWSPHIELAARLVRT